MPRNKIFKYLLTRGLEKSLIQYFLLEELNLSYGELVLKKDISVDEISEVNLTRALRGEPLQYIYNRAYFYDKEFYVNESVLIPRPETETLVETIIKTVQKELSFSKKISFADFGSGSGCIGISLLNYIADSNCDFYDYSKEALLVVKKNLDKYNLKNRATLVYKDLNNETISEKYDFIVSNPPYVIKGDRALDNQVSIHEPDLALYSEDRGMFHVKKWISLCLGALKNKGIMFFELGYNHKNELSPYLDKLQLDYKWIKDLNGVFRFLIIKLQ